MTAPYAGPDAPKNLFSRSLGQIEIENDEPRARGFLSMIQIFDKLDGMLPVRKEDEFTANGVLLQSLANQAGIGKIIFDEKNPRCLLARFRSRVRFRL